MASRLKKGDTVMVLAGKDKGKKNKIIRVLVEDDAYVVEGLNLAKRHRRPSQKFQGGIIDTPVPIAGSKLALICTRCSQPTRVGFKVVDNLKKVRTCKKCSEIIDKV